MNEIDLRGMTPRIRPALPGLGGSNPRGDSIGFTNAYMTFNGKPWLAVSGEIHHARCPQRDWKDELRKMKAGGIDIASTYVFWIHHEEEEGVFDWSGDRDLRLFVQLCAEAGLYVIVRIGPFCHGEVRNGGFPDWLYGRPFAVRSNDGRYLALVRRLYTEIGRRLEGLYFKDGGPIIGVQLENAFMHASAPWETTPRLCLEWIPGGTGGVAHMRALKKLAREAGIEVPIYTSTGWGGAPVLEGEVLPLYGGYSLCPWNVTESTPVHSPTREYVFRDFHGEGQRYDVFDPPYDPAAYPFACCEIGGGMQPWYRYRAVAPAESIEAMAVVKLAGGIQLLGYYMFHGGYQSSGRAGLPQRARRDADLSTISRRHWANSARSANPTTGSAAASVLLRLRRPASAILHRAPRGGSVDQPKGHGCASIRGALFQRPGIPFFQQLPGPCPDPGARGSGRGAAAHARPDARPVRAASR